MTSDFCRVITLSPPGRICVECMLTLDVPFVNKNDLDEGNMEEICAAWSAKGWTVIDEEEDAMFGEDVTPDDLTLSDDAKLWILKETPLDHSCAAGVANAAPGSSRSGIVGWGFCPHPIITLSR